MAKTSTHFSIASFPEGTHSSISQNEKNLKEDSLQEFDSYPSEEAIKNILNYSKALKIERSREVGLIEIVLN